MATLNLDALASHDFYYFKLHGLRDEPFWYGDAWQTAITLEQIQSINWTGKVAFVANCYGVDTSGQLDIMPRAILEGGARAVIAGQGYNYAALTEITGADLLGQWLRRLMTARLSPHRSFHLVQQLLHRWYTPKRLKHLPGQRRLAAEDSLQFRIFPKRISPKERHER